MITKEEFKQIVADCNDVLFFYNEQPCGITSEATNSIPVFELWYGNKLEEFTTADALLNAPFFDNKSLLDLYDSIKFRFI